MGATAAGTPAQHGQHVLTVLLTALAQEQQLLKGLLYLTRPSKPAVNGMGQQQMCNHLLFAACTVWEVRRTDTVLHSKMGLGTAAPGPT